MSQPFYGRRRVRDALPRPAPKPISGIPFHRPVSSAELRFAGKRVVETITDDDYRRYAAERKPNV